MCGRIGGYKGAPFLLLSLLTIVAVLFGKDPSPAWIRQALDVVVLHEELPPGLLWLGGVGLQQVHFPIKLLQGQPLLPLERHVSHIDVSHVRATVATITGLV